MKQTKAKDEVIEYRIQSILSVDHILVISSVICLGSLDDSMIFEKICFFITMVIVIFEHKIFESFYTPNNSNNIGFNRFLSDTLTLIKYTSYVGFVSGLYSMLFIS